jgi:transcriptional regulator with XRE-family HTH domain
MTLMKKPPNASRFGPLLRELRERRSVTQRELARVIGVSFSFLCDVERGARGPLRPEAISKAARYLKVSKFDLVFAAESDVIERWRKRGES